MTDKTSYTHGEFNFVDLNAHDMDAARRWYADLFGWDAATQDTGGGPPYAMFLLGGAPIAGLGHMNQEMREAGVRPMWNSYIDVDDAAATAARAAELGGTILSPVMKVMDAGSMAFIRDPFGAVFAIWQAAAHAGSGRRDEPGAPCWNELATPDRARAKAFYGELFGWRFVDESHDGAGTYTKILAGDGEVGGILEMDDKWEGVPSHWMVYFAVADADATAATIKATGGEVCVPPMDIPVGRFSVVNDPQGAVFTILQRKDEPAD